LPAPAEIEATLVDHGQPEPRRRAPQSLGSVRGEIVIGRRQTFAGGAEPIKLGLLGRGQ
jgi:hypothetical protein